MKRAFWITAAAVVVCAVAAFLFYSRAVNPQLLAPATPLTFTNSSGYSAQFAPSAPIVEAIRGWVAGHQSGWHLSFVSYASRSRFSCDTFSIELGARYIVLNYARRRG